MLPLATSGARLMCRRRDIHEGFVDDEQTTALAKIGGKRQEIAARKEPAVGIIGVGNDHERRIANVIEAAHGFDAMAGERGRAGMFGIAGGQNRRATGRHQAGNDRQHDLGARGRHHMRRRRRAVGARRRQRECIDGRWFGQAGEQIRPQDAGPDRDGD